MTTPTLWIYGGADTSVPVARSVAILERIADDRGRPFTIEVIPNANHVWILGGGPCQTRGRSYDWPTRVFGWLEGVRD